MPYSPPSIGPSGLTVPVYSDILSRLMTSFLGVYGGSCYLGPDSADFQFMSVFALMLSDANGGLQGNYLSLNPLTATGPSLDLVGVTIGTPRKTASFSSAAVTLTGTPGAVITGGVVQDNVGNYWTLLTPVTIGGGGTVSTTATAMNPGNITANANVITMIATPTAGWTAVTNPAAAAAGQPVETDSEYRARLLISQTLPSISLIAGTAAIIAAVPSVTRSKVYENPTDSTDINGLPAHSITAVVEGGIASAIAQAIYSKKGIGGLSNGTTTISVTDPNNAGITQPVSFTILGYLPISVGLNVHPLAGFTSVIQSNIVTAVINYLNSLGIGHPVVWSEIFGAALTARPDPDNPTFSISAVQDAYLAASTTGAVNFSFTLLVSSAAGIVIGQIVFGTGIQNGSVVTNIAGTTITLSLVTTANVSGIPVTFFTVVAPGVSIPVPYNKAAQGLSQYVGISLV